MRLAFAGYGELGATVLDELVVRHSVVVVVTHPTVFGGLSEPDVLELAERRKIPVLISKHAHEPAIAARLASEEVDALVSTNWRTLLPAHLLSLPRLGCLNVHDALLPKYSGFGAVNWGIRNGERRTGVTVHMMEEQFDTGPLIVQQTVPIEPDDSAETVYRRVLDRYVPATLEALKLIDEGFCGTPQNLAERTFYHRVELKDVRIDWRSSSRQIHDLVRAQSDPYVNAWTWWNGGRLFVKSTSLPVTAYRGTPGRVIGCMENGVAVACGRLDDPSARGIILRSVQPEGSETVPAAGYFKRGGGYLGEEPEGRR